MVSCESGVVAVVCTLVYDGDCGLCVACARWANVRGVTVASWQDLGLESLTALGLTISDVESAAWWVDGDGRLARGSFAIARALVAIGGPWRMLGAVMLIPPASWVGRAIYPMVVRHRHRLGPIARLLQRRT